MDSGAYGSYPSKTRYSGNRNYKFGRALRRKGYRTKGARINPVNQFTYNKTRVGRMTKTNMQQLKATFSTQIHLPPSSNSYSALPGFGTQYINLSQMLLGSPEFVSRQTQYSYYMLSGMSVTYTRQWIDPLFTTTGSFTPGLDPSTYGLGLSMLSCNFYPNLVSTVIGLPIQDADSSWKVSPFIHGSQSHYQPFPKNFTTGTNSNGLGVWNACSQAANIQGELALYNDPTFTVTNGTDGIFIVWYMEINLYCSFCNNTGA